ncbi:hypothetical protein CFP56_020145, partial [Quercus suber]
MEHLKTEGVESQNQLPQLEQPGKGTTFLKTCFNGVNTLSGLSFYLGEYAFYIERGDTINSICTFTRRVAELAISIPSSNSLLVHRITPRT